MRQKRDRERKGGEEIMKYRERRGNVIEEWKEKNRVGEKERGAEEREKVKVKKRKRAGVIECEQDRI